MAKRQRHLYEFGPFTLDPTTRLLLRDGEPIPLQPKAFDTLLLLVERRGEVLGKEELITRLWPDSFVEESNLSQNVYVLRKALGQSGVGREYIRTVPKHGYQFVADVRESGGVSAEENLRSHPTTEEPGDTAPAADAAGAGRMPDAGTPAAARPARTGVRRSTSPVLIASALTVGLIVGLYFWVRSRERKAETPGAVRSLAVLPFKPLVTEGRDESLELGMADTLITRLGAVRQITVRPVSAVRRYTGLEQDPVAAGRELGVEAVLDGHIQRAGEKVRVTVRLVRVEDGKALWADKFDEPFTDIFAVQDSISGQVANSLGLRLGGEERRQLAKRYTENAAAYELYLKGRYFWNKRKGEEFEKAIDYFQRAIALDPDYALAYSGLADSYSLLSGYSGATVQEMSPRAKEAAGRALELDDTLAEAHTSLALVKIAFERDWAGAEREYKLALDLNPNYAFAHHRYGHFLCLLGRFDEGLAELERARQLDPLSLIINADVGLAYYFARRYDQSIDQLRKTIEMDPDFAQARIYLAGSYVQKGMFAEAIAEAQKASELTGGRSGAVLSYSYAAAGRTREAREALDGVMARPERWSYVVALAATYATLGDKEMAFEQLEGGYKRLVVAMHRLGVDPKMDSLRPDPRFQDLVRRVGLSP